MYDFRPAGEFMEWSEYLRTQAVSVLQLYVRDSTEIDFPVGMTAASWDSVAEMALTPQTTA
jgi:hypothetical protein